MHFGNLINFLRQTSIDQDVAIFDNFSCFTDSPTIELDEILMSSCKKRIAPWIVKHLKPMSDGLIENRFLFKKVARHIAEKVILHDQYPGECSRSTISILN